MAHEWGEGREARIHAIFSSGVEKGRPSYGPWGALVPEVSPWPGSVWSRAFALAKPNAYGCRQEARKGRTDQGKKMRRWRMRRRRRGGE